MIAEYDMDVRLCSLTVSRTFTFTFTETQTQQQVAAIYTYGCAVYVPCAVCRVNLYGKSSTRAMRVHVCITCIIACVIYMCSCIYMDSMYG